jgi:hypothetical protein
MVLPVANYAYFGCNLKTNGALEDPRVGPFSMGLVVPLQLFIVHTATLDGQPIDYLDSIVIHGQDGDFVSRLNYGKYRLPPGFFRHHENRLQGCQGLPPFRCWSVCLH